MRNLGAVDHDEPRLAQTLYHLGAIPFVGLGGAILLGLRDHRGDSGVGAGMSRRRRIRLRTARERKRRREQERAHQPHHTVFISATSFDSDAFASPNSRLVLSL